MVSLEIIQSICTGKIAFSEPLGSVTSFRIGGPADFYIEPMNRDELIALSKYFRSQNFPFIIIGNGSNILVSDEGYRGAVINLEKGFSHIEMRNDLVCAGSGIRMSKFVDYCIMNGLSGTEMLAGIPGTLGGAIVMNAGAYGGEISDYLMDVTIVRDENILTLKKQEAGFSYRSSFLQHDIIVEASFKLDKGNMDALMMKRRELLQKRNTSQPTSFPNAGSIFKNPAGTFAAKLIEESGLKGFSIGDAEVSAQHANFIINKKSAKAEEVLQVIKHVRLRVYEQFGILLALEVKPIGFSSEVLSEIDDKITQNLRAMKG